MSLSTIAFCPGGDLLPTEEVIAQHTLEYASTDIHKYFMNNIYAIAKQGIDLHNAIKTLENQNLTNIGQESVENTIVIIKSAFTALFNFIKELLAKVVTFFKQIFSRTTQNSEITQSNIRIIEQRIAKDPMEIKKLKEIKLAPCARYIEFVEFAKNVSAAYNAVDRIFGTDKLKLVHDKIFLNDLGKQHVKEGDTYRIQVPMEGEWIDICKKIGLDIIVHDYGDDYYKFYRVDSVYGSVLKDTLSRTEPMSLYEAGYDQENLKYLLNEYIVPFSNVQKAFNQKIEFLETLKANCRKALQHLDKFYAPSSKENFDSLSTARILTEYMVSLSTIIVLHTKMCSAIDEVVSYHKLITTAILRGT